MSITNEDVIIIRLHTWYRRHQLHTSAHLIAYIRNVNLWIKAWSESSMLHSCFVHWYWSESRWIQLETLLKPSSSVRMSGNSIITVLCEVWTIEFRVAHAKAQKVFNEKFSILFREWKNKWNTQTHRHTDTHTKLYDQITIDGRVNWIENWKTDEGKPFQLLINQSKQYEPVHWLAPFFFRCFLFHSHFLLLIHSICRSLNRNYFNWCNQTLGNFDDKIGGWEFLSVFFLSSIVEWFKNELHFNFKRLNVNSNWKINDWLLDIQWFKWHAKLFIQPVVAKIYVRNCQKSSPILKIMWI